MKMIIAPAFKKWLKQASKEDLKKLCLDVNDLAAALKAKK